MAKDQAAQGARNTFNMAGQFLLFVLVTSMLAYAAEAINCQPYHHSMDASLCSAADTQKTEYRMLEDLLEDAKAAADTPAMGFLWNATLETYLFLHPCVRRAEVALMMFYGMHIQIPAPNWEAQMEQLMDNASPYAGRRRAAGHSYSYEERVILDLLTNLLQATNAGCLQKLLDEYKDYAAQSFKASVTGFQIPPGSVPVSVYHPSHTPKPTTPKPTTPKPTTPKPTTPKPTTARPTTTPKPTTPPTTTHKPAHTTPAPMMCSKCAGMDCFFSGDFESTVKPCNAADQLCFIEVDDQGTGRHITRGCMPKDECRRIHNHNCNNVETATRDDDLHCKFCCDQDRCNFPPSLLPVAGTVYPHHGHH